MRIKITGLSAVFILLTTFLAAQSKDAEKYKKESEEIRKQVWAWEDAKFKVRDIPQEFANASKVVIARHTELTAESKSKITFTGLGFGSKKDLTITEVAREVIKINDKKSVEEYSELSFTQFAKTSGFMSKKKTTSYIGIRVIKPGGVMKEINADEIVLTKDASSEKQAKLAIPDLAPGDIVDYFIATEQQLTDAMSDSDYNVLLFDDAPVMNISFHAQLGKKYAIDYRSYNGAPELSVSKNSDKEIIVDMEAKNIQPFETSLWVSAAQQLPFIRMYISLGYRGPGSRMYNMTRPGEVTKHTNGMEAMNDKAQNLSLTYTNEYWSKSYKSAYDEVEKNAKNRAKSLGLSFNSLNDTEKAALLFYSFRYDYLMRFNISQLAGAINRGRNQYNDFTFYLFGILKNAGLNPAIFVAGFKNGYRMDDAMTSGDFVDAVYLPGTKQFIFLNTIYDIPFTVPSYLDGTETAKSITFDHPAIMGVNKRMNLSNVEPGMKVKETEAKENARIEKLRVTVDPEKALLQVKRNTTLKGHYKYDIQKNLILYEDYYESEGKLMGGEKSLIEVLESDKKGKNYVGEVKNAFAEARAKQKDAFVADAKNWFEQEVTDLTDTKIENMGVRHTAPDFIYSSSFNLGGLVKKGGNNIIVEVGKLQGQPLTVREDQRKRTIDVHMPFARTIEYQIDLEIPEGYTAEGLQALNVSVENETGFFKTEAIIMDKSVLIKVKKQYSHSFEPAANFEKLLQFMDASGTWTSAKILFKKK